MTSSVHGRAGDLGVHRRADGLGVHRRAGVHRKAGGLGVHRRAGGLKCSQEGQVCAREICMLLLTNLCDRMWCQLSSVPRTYLDLWGQ